MSVQCEIVTNVEDTAGYPCGRDVLAKCSDCGTALCDSHNQHCELCNQTFCTTCLAFHNREQHQKKPAAMGESQRAENRLRRTVKAHYTKWKRRPVIAITAVIFLIAGLIANLSDWSLTVWTSFRNLDRVESESTREQTVIVRYRIRFHREAIYSHLSTNPSMSQEEIAVAVAIRNQPLGRVFSAALAAVIP